MSNPFSSTPVLSYIGAVDTVTSSSGTTLFSILFDSLAATHGNILMFEYKIQRLGSDTNPDNVTLGYVNFESVTQSVGVSNQWTLAVPAVAAIDRLPEYDYDPEIPAEISVRVYSGLTEQSDIAVSEWSNTLDLHVPPKAPVIVEANYYDNNLNQDDLYVYISHEPSYILESIQFIVAYYFQDVYGDTNWAVSDPITGQYATFSNQNVIRIVKDNIGQVNTTSQVVYTAVYAVFPFTHNADPYDPYTIKNYYSVSEISNTYNAEPASNTNYPEITSINYLVYDSIPGQQTMVVNWKFIGDPNIFGLASYILQKSTDNTNWTTVASGLSPTTTSSYSVDVSEYDCGTTVYFRVIAISNVESESTSNTASENMFYRSDAPSSVIVNWAAAASANEYIDLSVTITLENDWSPGCGDVETLRVQVYNNNAPAELIRTQDVAYEGNRTYLVNLNDVEYTSSGTVKVFAVTTDTNSSYEQIDGNFTIAAFISDALPIFITMVVNEERTEAEFEVVTNNQLAPVGRLFWIADGSGVNVKLSTIPGDYGTYTVVRTLDPYYTEAYIYNFTVTAAAFNDSETIPYGSGVAVSNTAGISINNFENTL